MSDTEPTAPETPAQPAEPEAPPPFRADQAVVDAARQRGMIDPDRIAEYVSLDAVTTPEDADRAVHALWLRRGGLFGELTDTRPAHEQLGHHRDPATDEEYQRDHERRVENMTPVLEALRRDTNWERKAAS